MTHLPLDPSPVTPENRWRTGTHPLDPRRLGSTVAVVGGLVFAWAYGADTIAAPLLLIVRLIASCVAAAAFVTLFVRPVSLGEPRRVHPAAGLIYAGSVAAMLAGIMAGRGWLTAHGAVQALPSWVVTCVGLHFVPFALAFRERMLLWLGWIVGGLGMLFVALALGLGAAWGDAGALVASIVQPGIIAAWASGRLPFLSSGEVSRRG